MFDVNQIPGDILLCISQLLEPSFCRILRLVSHHFHDIFTPSALHTAYITIPTESHSPEHITQAEHPIPSDFAPLSNLYAHTKCLQINCLGKTREDIDPNVRRVVSNLNSLTTLLLWGVAGRPDGHWLEHLISSVIGATGGNLERLQLDARSGNAPDIIANFRGLKELSYAVWRPHYHKTASNHTKTLIAKNPTLEILSFCSPEAYTIDDILPSSPPLALRDIHLEGFRPSLGYPQLSFVNLRTVHLRPQNANDDLDPFWRTLDSATSCLEEIRTPTITPSLLRYLSSFVGLRTFAFNMPRAIISVDADMIASFFDTVLPKHWTTLETLHLRLSARDASNNTDWYLSPRRWPLSQLVSLKTLEMLWPKDMSLTKENVQGILDAFQGLQLDQLKVDWNAPPPGARMPLETVSGLKSQTGYPKKFRLIIMGSRLPWLKCCKLVGADGWDYHPG